MLIVERDSTTFLIQITDLNENTMKKLENIYRHAKN